MNSKITTFKKRIYFSETDVTGLVYHARWLEWMEAVRMEMLESNGINIDELHKHNMTVVVSEISCKYISPIKLGQVVETRAWVEKVGGPSLLIKYEFWNLTENKKAGEASSLVVFIDAKKIRPIRVPAGLRKRFEPEISPSI